MPVTFGTVPNPFTDPATDIVTQQSQPSNLFQSILGGAGDVLGLLGRPASAVAGFANGLFVKNDVGKAFNFAKQGFMGDRQFNFAQTLKQLGMPKYGSGIKIPFIGEITGRGTLGFALDVALDPLTYTGLLGLTKSAKYIPKGLGLAEREALGGTKQTFNKLYGGLLESALKTDADKIDAHFETVLKNIRNDAKNLTSNFADAPPAPHLSKLPAVDPRNQMTLAGEKIDFAAAGLPPGPSTHPDTRFRGFDTVEEMIGNKGVPEWKPYGKAVYKGFEDGASDNAVMVQFKAGETVEGAQYRSGGSGFDKVAGKAGEPEKIFIQRDAWKDPNTWEGVAEDFKKVLGDVPVETYTIDQKTGKAVLDDVVNAKSPFEVINENTQLKALLKTQRGQEIRTRFDQEVLPQLRETFKANELAGFDPTQVKLHNDAAQILDQVTDLNMSSLQMYRNIAANDMGFLGHTLTDQAAKGYRSVITFLGKSPAEFAAAVGMPELLVKQLRAIDVMVFKGIDATLGQFKTRLPKFSNQLYRMFHSGTGIPEVDETISKFAGQEDSDLRDAMVTGIKTLNEQKKLTEKLPPNQVRQFYKDVMDQLEFANPNNILMTNTIPARQFMEGSEKFAQELRVILDDTYKKKLSTARALNLPDIRYLKGYFPRELSDEMKILLKKVLDDAPGGTNSVLAQAKRSRTGDFAKLTTSEINEFLANDAAGFEHIRQAATDPNSKWAAEIKKATGKDPEMWSMFIDDPAQAIIMQNINSTRTASKAALTQSLLTQFGRVAWDFDEPRKFGEYFLAPNIYKVTDMTKLGPGGMHAVTREALGLNKNTKVKQLDLIAESLKNFNTQDRIDAAINPDKFVASKGGDLSAVLLANLPAHNIHAFGLLHDLQAPVYVMDEQIHRLIENMWTKVNDPNTYNVFLKGIDKATDFWKRSVTVSFPSFHFRNMLQDMWQMYLDGFNPVAELGGNGALTHSARMMKVAGIVGKLEDLPEAAENISKLTDYVTRNDGSTRPLKDMWNAFIKNGGLGGVLRDIPINGQTSVDTINEALRSKFLSGTSLNPLNKNFVTVAAGGKINEVVSVYNRFANYVSLWKKGMDDFGAIMNTKKVLFDYQDLSSFERNFMKRVFPFYAWTRKNIPFQLKMMVQEPGKFANLMKAVNALEDKNVRSQIPPEGIPDYIRQEFGITTKQNDDGSYRFLLMGGYIPAADLIKVGSLEDAGRLASKSLNPILQIPAESITNKNFFSGLPIRDFPGEKGIFLGTALNKDLINAARKFRPLNSADKLFFKEDPNNPYQRKELTRAEKVVASVTGLNPRDLDVTRIAENKQRDIKNLASKLNANYKRAVASGDLKMQEYLENLIEESQASQFSR